MPSWTEHTWARTQTPWFAHNAKPNARSLRDQADKVTTTHGHDWSLRITAGGHEHPRFEKCKRRTLPETTLELTLPLERTVQNVHKWRSKKQRSAWFFVRISTTNKYGIPSEASTRIKNSAHLKLQSPGLQSHATDADKYN